jgi:hypothetical protein
MRKRCLCILTFVIVCIILLRLLFERLDFNAPSTTNKFDNFDNVTGAQKAIVPDVVHFILFGHNSLEFVTFLSILSALKVLSMVFVLFDALDTSNIFELINKVGRFRMHCHVLVRECALI